MPAEPPRPLAGGLGSRMLQERGADDSVGGERYQPSSTLIRMALPRSLLDAQLYKQRIARMRVSELDQPMQICLVGGIFGKPPQYRAQVQRTPETTLAEGLRARGHEVTIAGHHDLLNYATFDVVHVHHLGYGAVGAAADVGRTPLVFTNHAFTRTSYARRKATEYVLSRSSASVTLSAVEAEWQAKEYPRARSRTVVIPNGVDERLFRYSPPEVPDGDQPWKLLYVGQLTHMKGVDYLLRALALLSVDRNIELSLVYHIDRDEPGLRDLAARLGLRSVYFLGPRAPEKLAALYAEHHLLVLPSLSEALPSVISESLLVGRPVVGSEVGAIKAQVGSFGQTVRPGDPQALAGAIKSTLGRFDMLASRSREASEEAAKLYSVSAMVNAHEALYETCTQIGDGRPRGPYSATSHLVADVQDRLVRHGLRLRGSPPKITPVSTPPSSRRRAN